MSERKNEKILLVEDEPNIAKLFSYNLKKAGYEHEIAGDGLEGYEKAKSFKPDLIISDIMMPKADGFEFRRMLLKDENLKSTPFIFLTAKGSEDDILEGYDLGIEDYIIKTASAKVVLAKISAILASRAKERKKAVEEVQTAADNMAVSVVPSEFPEFEGFDIKHWHVPFKNIPGGDFIDYFKLSEKRFAVILGDVMGKRWGAWYFAIAYAGYVRAAIRFAMQRSSNLLPSEILKYVNQAVYNDERISEVFITLSVVVIDKSENKAYYSGAGDLPIVLKKEKVDLVQSGGLLLGFSPDSEYEDIEISMNKGDIIYLYSDGIPDSRNPEGIAYGKERFNQRAAEISEENDCIEFMKEDFIGFTNGEYDDDVSLIAVRML